MQKFIPFVASLAWGLINLVVIAHLIIYPSSRVKGMILWVMYTGLWSSVLSSTQIGFDNTGAGKVFLGQGLVGLLAGGLSLLYTHREKKNSKD